MTAVGKGSGEALGDIWDTVKGMVTHPIDNGSGLLGAGSQAYEHIKESVPILHAYEDARAQGKGVLDSISAANEKAKQIHEAHDGIKQRIDEFKKQPGIATVRALGNAATIAATIYDGGKLNPANLESPVKPTLPTAMTEAATEVPEAASGVPPKTSPIESAVQKGAAKSGLPEGEAASVAPKGEDIQPTLQQKVTDTLNKTAKDNGLQPVTSADIRNIGKDLGDQFYTRSKAGFDAVKDATGIDLNVMKDRINTLNDKILDAVDNPEKAGQLEQQKLGLENDADAAFKQAKEKGIDVDQPQADWKKFNAAYDFGTHIRMSAKGRVAEINPETFANRIEKLASSNSPTQPGRLQQLMGEDDAAALKGHAYDAQEAAQQIKEFTPSSSTGQKAMQDLLRPNTTGRLVLPGAKTNFLKAFRDFDALATEEQVVRFGKDAMQARNYLKTQARIQLAKRIGTGIGLGIIAKETGLTSFALHALLE